MFVVFTSHTLFLRVSNISNKYNNGKFVKYTLVHGHITETKHDSCSNAFPVQEYTLAQFRVRMR